MPLYLVEHYTDDPGPTLQMVAEEHELVEADSEVQAVAKVSTFSPMFGASELREYIPGYLWEAADGSMAILAVRRLPDRR